MATPEQMQQAREAEGKRAVQDMDVLHSRLDFAVAEARRDGLADWAIKKALEETAKSID